MSGDDLHDDAEFERFLAGEGELSAYLKYVPQAEPPAALDAAVLASVEAALAAEKVQTMVPQPAANDASGPMPQAAQQRPLRRLSRYWALPVGLAAGVVVAVVYHGFVPGQTTDVAAVPAAPDAQVAQVEPSTVIKAKNSLDASLPVPAKVIADRAEVPPPKVASPEMPRLEAERELPLGKSAPPAPEVAPSRMAAPPPVMAVASPPPVPASPVAMPSAPVMPAPPVKKEALARSTPKPEAAASHYAAPAAASSENLASGTELAWNRDPAKPGSSYGSVPKAVPSPDLAYRGLPSPTFSASAPPPEARPVAPITDPRQVAPPSQLSAAAAHADPVKWLALIEQKIQANDTKGALAEWDGFLKAHPAFPVKDDLTSKIKALREQQNTLAPAPDPDK